MGRNGQGGGEADVVIAGAGPVGLVAALVLARAGVRVVLLEKRHSLNTASKASTFHPATLEILNELGLLDSVLAEGEVVRTIQYRTPDGVFAEFPMDRLAAQTPFPYRLHLEQARVTPIALERLRGYANATVMFDTEIVSVAQDGEGVTVGVRSGDRDGQLRAAYLLGTDGARSATREALGIDFEGVNYPDKILRIMTTDDLGKLMPGLESITYLFNAGKSVSFLRMPDCWRIILRVPEAVDEKTATSIEWITDRLREVLPSWTTPPGIVDLDIYSVSRRIASRYREGRVFLAGDSAHVTNTRGGMNMNCGIHDSYEIANALVAALKAGRPDLVEAAADERLRVAREMLIPRTDRNITGGVAWLDKIKAMAASPSESTEYLATAAMLDMVTRPLRVA